MRVPLLSLVGRLTAGALLFQATAPAALVVKQGVDLAGARGARRPAWRP